MLRGLAYAARIRSVEACASRVEDGEPNADSASSEAKSSGGRMNRPAGAVVLRVAKR